ncbi:MAG: hypothetical protein HKN47_03040 [Pirellulaceae bacterium]|nr:hypothetical protein [Pirellulaceae bacterium]
MTTTAEILAQRALQTPCGEQCVDWALALLESGRDGAALCRLASCRPPYNHFELASLRDQALIAMRLDDVSNDDADAMYASELLAAGLAGESVILDAVAHVKDLCLANNYQRELYDFYLLYFANSDLQEQDIQHYWPEADRSNIDAIIRERVLRFLDARAIDRSG